MIIEIPNENSIVKWKNDDKDEWKVAEISDLIKVYERPQDCSDCKRYDSPYFEVKFDKEQMQELVDKAKAEVLASIERPQGEWKSLGFVHSRGYAWCICSNCGKTTKIYLDKDNDFCCIADIRNKAVSCLFCGAEMKKGGAV